MRSAIGETPSNVALASVASGDEAERFICALPIFTGNATRWGWAIGAGLEYAFTPAWSGKVESQCLLMTQSGHGASQEPF